MAQSTHHAPAPTRNWLAACWLVNLHRMDPRRAPILPGGERGAAGFGINAAAGNATSATEPTAAGSEPSNTGSTESRASGIVVVTADSCSRSSAQIGVRTARPALARDEADEDDMHLRLWQPPASIIAVHRELFMLRRSGTFESQPMSIVWDDDNLPRCAHSEDEDRVSGFRLLVCNLSMAGDAAVLTAERVGLVVTILDNQVAPGEALAPPVTASIAGTTQTGAGFVSDLDELRERVARVPTVRQHVCFDLGDCDDARGAMLSVFQRAGVAIDACRQRGETAVVHCRAGVSRSPAVALSWMERRGVPLEEAIAHMLLVRPQVQPNYGFFASLLRWAETHDEDVAVAELRTGESHATRQRLQPPTTTTPTGCVRQADGPTPDGVAAGTGACGIAIPASSVRCPPPAIAIAPAQQRPGPHGAVAASDALGTEGAVALVGSGADGRSGFGGAASTGPQVLSDDAALLSPLSTLDSVASSGGGGPDRASGFAAGKQLPCADARERCEPAGAGGRGDEEEDELSLSASALGGALASALAAANAVRGATEGARSAGSDGAAGGIPPRRHGAPPAASRTAAGPGSAGAPPARTHTVERPSSASVPAWLRYSDAAADRMAQAIARRIGMAVGTPPGSAWIGSARTSASMCSGAGSPFSPDGRTAPAGALSLRGLGGGVAVSRGSRQRPPRPSVDSATSFEADGDGSWAGGGVGGSGGDATPDSAASTPKKPHRRRLLGPGGRELSLNVDS